MPSIKIKRLTGPAFKQALAALKDRDPDMKDILSNLGPPPMWRRAPGFQTLIRIILEQQVSLASAKAAFDRLRQALPNLTPGQFLMLGDERLKQFGFSRQKTRYCRQLAEAISTKSLQLEGLERMDDEKARAELLKITGIGRWTADIYLLMALRRTDVWPVGDLALAIAVQRVKRLGSRPSSTELEVLSHKWKPWRAVAARVFWHYYLSYPI